MKRKGKLPVSFYLQDTVTVARALLGCTLWHMSERGSLGARIVETEAYLGANDPASHARRGLRSDRNQSMYLEGGHAYVYFTYGMHYCINVVTAEEGNAEAVLLRAGEPVEGVTQMWKNRPKAKRESDLLSGPGKMCMAMGIDRKLDGEPLRGARLFITERESPVNEADIAVTPRVGIESTGDAAHWPLRFFLAGNSNVSVSRSFR